MVVGVSNAAGPALPPGLRVASLVPGRHATLPAMDLLQSLASRLETAASAILALRPAVEARSPWPMAELYGTEAEARWGPPEVLAHLEEMLPFWLGEMERILDGPGGAPVPFGRVATDTVRIAIIGRDRTVPVRELFARVESDATRLAARMRQLNPADVEREGIHPRLGVLTVGALLERFTVTHLEEHVEQLRESLDLRPA
jgi:hypothetical protein